MSPTTIEFEAHPKQLEFLDSTAATVVFRGGAGSGKTLAGVMWALKQGLAKPGSRGMIVSATHPQLEQAVLPHLLDVATKTGLVQDWRFNKSARQVTLPNGSVFWLRSADRPESLLGADLAWLWGDEAGLWKPDAWRFCASRIRQPGFEHQIAVTFTPKGRNWAWHTFGQPRAGLHIVEVTTLDNPYIGVDLVNRLRDEYGEGSQFWRQEVLGEYVAFEGLVYPDFVPERHIDEPPVGQPFANTVGGVDWGWTNPGVIVVARLDGEGVMWLVSEVHERQRSIEWWARAAADLQESHHVSGWYCDPSEPANIDALRRAGVRAERANNDVVPGITAVGSRFSAGTIRIAPACANVIAELAGYCWRRRADGSTIADEPEKVNDHAMDAMRYAVMGLTTPRTTFMQSL